MKRFLFCFVMCAILSFSSCLGERTLTVVSLGDSYSSGEGIEPFYGQDRPLAEKIHDPDWLAHRSEKSWPGQLRFEGLEGTLGDHRGVYEKNADGGYTLAQDGSWFFVAASGAMCRDLAGRQSVAVNRSEGGASFSAVMRLDPQLEIFDALAADGRCADYVTLTLGGNDLGFQQTLTALLLDSPLGRLFGGTLSKESKTSLEDNLNAIWGSFYAEGGIREAIMNAYRSIAEAAGPQAAVIVAGYPALMSESGSGVASKKNIKLLNESVARFNEELESIVHALRDEGYNIHFVSVEAEFKGHEAYSSSEYLNGIFFDIGEQDHDESAPANSRSMHPNELGAQAYARCVQAKIDELEATKGN